MCQAGTIFETGETGEQIQLLFNFNSVRLKAAFGA